MKRGGMTERDIRFLCDDPAQFQQKARPEISMATRDNVLLALYWLTSGSKPGDQLYFVFCGQGAQIVSEEFADRRLCENALVPTDVLDGGDHPRLVTDTDVHKAFSSVPAGAKATLIYDSCHAGRVTDRSGALPYLTEYVSRGRVDYEKLRGHPVLPRFLELPSWKARPAMENERFLRESRLQCQAVQWSACANQQFCVELPIEERPRGVFTYIFISTLLKVGTQASSGNLLREARELTEQLKGKWRLQQDVQLTCSFSTSENQPFLLK